MLATRPRCTVQGCSVPNNGLSPLCHRHDQIEQACACEVCGADDKPLAWVAGRFVCRASRCSTVCTRCGEVGGVQHSASWWESETGWQSEDGCSLCLSGDESAA